MQTTIIALYHMIKEFTGCSVPLPPRDACDASKIATKSKDQTQISYSTNATLLAKRGIKIELLTQLECYFLDYQLETPLLLTKLAHRLR